MNRNIAGATSGPKVGDTRYMSQTTQHTTTAGNNKNIRNQHMSDDKFLITTMRALLELLYGVSLTADPPSERDTFCSSGMAHSSHNTASGSLFVPGNMVQDGQGGMIMYMDGFRFSLLGKNNPCLNLYFPGWTLDTRSKFWWAMMGVVLLGIITEGVSKLRSLSSKRLSGFLKRVTITVLHGIQALVGYILMLATMTFSIELLTCVIVGLGLGFALFYDDEDAHVTTNPVSPGRS